MIERYLRGVVGTVVDEKAFDALCASEGKNAVETLDALARHIARGYNHGSWTFTDADSAITSLWGFLITRASREDWIVPAFFFAVYEAFDAGEYHHAEDSRSVDPEERYTKPVIAALVSSDQNATQQAVSADRAKPHSG